MYLTKLYANIRQNIVTQMEFGRSPCVNTPAFGQSAKVLLKVESGQELSFTAHPKAHNVCIN